MSSINSIASEKLARLIGTPKCPALVDVRTDDDFSATLGLSPVPSAAPSDKSDEWAAEFRRASAVVICHKGLKLSHGVAALLREARVSAEVLEGGFASLGASQPTARAGKQAASAQSAGPDRVGDARAAQDRPHRLPWLIRRFVDPAALFLFVSPSEVEGVAEQFGARLSISKGCSGAIAASPAPST